LPGAPASIVIVGVAGVDEHVIGFKGRGHRLDDAAGASPAWAMITARRGRSSDAANSSSDDAETKRPSSPCWATRSSVRRPDRL
jgi:hypothetical protein